MKTRARLSAQTILCMIPCFFLIISSSLASDIRPPRNPGLVLYVSPSGDDSWTGMAPASQSIGNQGPFATLERARTEIRNIKQKGGLPAGGIVVELAQGIYRLKNPLELSNLDSGTAMAPIVYKAEAGGEVRISGGVEIVNWQSVNEPDILKRLDPEVKTHIVQTNLRAAGIIDFGFTPGHELTFYYQDQPMTLARWPNDGFTAVGDVLGGQPIDVRGTVGDKVGIFTYEGDRPKRWTSEMDLWAHGFWFWDWSDERQRIQSINTVRHSISLAPPYHEFGYRKGQWYYVYNALSELDAPGEWYLDRQTGLLYFWAPTPLPGSAMVPVTSGLITMSDASYVTLCGIVFEGSREHGIVLQRGNNIAIRNCTIRNVSGWAVQIMGGTECGIAGSKIYNAGEGGVYLEGGDRNTLQSANHYVVNCDIHDYSRWFMTYRPGVSLAGVGQKVSNNHIHDAPHIAIYFSGNDHLIDKNEIHDVCRASNDAGAIYAGRDWTMRGTVVRNNFLHNINGFRDKGANGIYLDDMFSGATITGNLLYKVQRAILIGGGRDNLVDSNVFIDCDTPLFIDARALNWAQASLPLMTERLQAVPYTSAPWYSKYPSLPLILADEPAAPKGNRFTHNVAFGKSIGYTEPEAERFIQFTDNRCETGDYSGALSKETLSSLLSRAASFYGILSIPLDKIGNIGMKAPDQLRIN